MSERNNVLVKSLKETGFTIIDTNIFRNKNLSLKAKGLLSMMLSLPNDWTFSIAGLTALSRDGRDGLRSGLAELEKAGYLIIEQRHDDKGMYDGYKYTVFEEPFTETPFTEKPLTDNPHYKVLNNKTLTNKVLNNKKNIQKKLQIEESKSKEKDNVSVTLHNATSLIDNNISYSSSNSLSKVKTNKDSDNNIGKSKSIYTKTYLENKEVNDIFLNFLELRKSLKAKNTEQAIKLLLNKLEPLSDNDKIKALENSIMNSWKSVFPKEEKELKKAADRW